MFRNKCPKRTYDGKELSDYRAYKDQLATDFYQRCGYTDCSDFWFGGKRNFQIDHFKPHSKYPELKTKYSNLVYCCSYINRAKWDEDGDFLDPCDVDYNEHFSRDNEGNIIPNPDSPAAMFMYKKLKLYLKRYSIIWMLDQLDQRMGKLVELFKATDNPDAKDLLLQVTIKYDEYKRYLRAEQ